MSKLTTQTLVAAVMVFGVSGVVIADTDGKHCTLGALDGLYVFSATGYTIVPGGAPQPKAITEFIRFNGDGTLTSPAATRSLNGVVAQFVPGGTGTYTVANPDSTDIACSGTLTFTGGPSFDLFFVPEGDDVWMIQTNPNNVLQGKVTKVSH
jgi:hypothetical protein